MVLDREEHLGIKRQAEREEHERLLDRIEHPVVGRARGERPSELAHLDVQQR